LSITADASSPENEAERVPHEPEENASNPLSSIVPAEAKRDEDNPLPTRILVLQHLIRFCEFAGYAFRT